MNAGRVLLLWVISLTTVLPVMQAQAQTPPPCPQLANFVLQPSSPAQGDAVRLTLNFQPYYIAEFTRIGNTFSVVLGGITGFPYPPGGGPGAQFGSLEAGAYQVNISGAAVSCPNVSLEFTVLGSGTEARAVPTLTSLLVLMLAFLVLAIGLIGFRQQISKTRSP